ncbi:hypothetical protein PMIN01_09123 [Paraphaeosphaeria minitans]|uniref:Uncharacterized protein n=1 Tax=Paraphaeosphaeria minitans TaxID=565426 RepID=A0A9P6GE84_9PLEO|nr:hypothetical protein PMIN01_09123 [Paraphaeosphaeria minitans]
MSARKVTASGRAGDGEWKGWRGICGVEVGVEGDGETAGGGRFQGLRGGTGGGRRAGRKSRSGVVACDGVCKTQTVYLAGWLAGWLAGGMNAFGSRHDGRGGLGSSAQAAGVAPRYRANVPMHAPSCAPSLHSLHAPWTLPALAALAARSLDAPYALPGRSLRPPWTLPTPSLHAPCTTATSCPLPQRPTVLVPQSLTMTSLRRLAAVIRSGPDNVPSVPCPVSRVPCPESRVQSPESSVQCPVSSVQSPVPSAQPAHRVLLPNTPPPLSVSPSLHLSPCPTATSGWALALVHFAVLSLPAGLQSPTMPVVRRRAQPGVCLGRPKPGATTWRLGPELCETGVSACRSETKTRPSPGYFGLAQPAQAKPSSKRPSPTLLRRVAKAFADRVAASANQLPTSCPCPPAALAHQLPTICQPSANRLPTICQPSANHLPTICRASIPSRTSTLTFDRFHWLSGGIRLKRVGGLRQ